MGKSRVGEGSDREGREKRKGGKLVLMVETKTFTKI